MSRNLIPLLYFMFYQFNEETHVYVLCIFIFIAIVKHKDNVFDYAYGPRCGFYSSVLLWVDDFQQ